MATLLVVFGVATTASPADIAARLRGGASQLARAGMVETRELSIVDRNLPYLDGRRILEDLSGNAREGGYSRLWGRRAQEDLASHILSGILEQKSGRELHGHERSAAVYCATTTRSLVGQNDKFHAHLTVEETLMVAASLRLPGASKKERQKAVDKTLRQMQLKDAANTCRDDRSQHLRLTAAPGPRLRAVGKPRVVLPMNRPQAWTPYRQNASFLCCVASLRRAARSC